MTVLEQAYYVAGVITAVASILGLAGLAWYAIETRRLRVISHRQSETASAQLEGSVVPCVLFLEDPRQSGDATEGYLLLKNVGTGPALNIRYRLNSWADWATSPALRPGGSIKPGLKSKEVRVGGGAHAEFTSLSGKRYRSRSEFVTVPPANSLLLEHSFEDFVGGNRR